MGWERRGGTDVIALRESGRERAGAEMSDGTTQQERHARQHRVTTTEGKARESAARQHRVTTTSIREGVEASILPARDSDAALSCASTLRKARVPAAVAVAHGRCGAAKLVLDDTIWYLLAG